MNSLSNKFYLWSNNIAQIRKRTMRPLIADLLHTLKLNIGLPAQAEVKTATLRSLDGKPATIDDYVGKGQWSLVVIWATSCHVCAAEMPKYGAYYASAPEPKFSILGIAVDGIARKSAIVETMARWNMGFPSLVAGNPDFHRTYCELLKASRYDAPTFMLFDPSGRLMKLNVGPVWAAALEEFIRNHNLQ